MSGKLRWKVVLSSDLYGDEEFVYDTLKEARQGMLRLRKECKKQADKDLVPRTLTILGPGKDSGEGVTIWPKGGSIGKDPVIQEGGSGTGDAHETCG